MSLELSSTPTFAGHQTFHPRFGWIRKAFFGVLDDPFIFASSDSTVRLGVGKNMVEAIRFWGQATGVIEVDKGLKDKRGLGFRTTPFGVFLFDSESGYDPYLEDDSSLWLLHWQMLSPINSVPVWWVVFNMYAGLEFSSEDLLNVAHEAVNATSWKMPSQSSIEKDVDAVIRMYSSRGVRGRQTLDDMLDSPFRATGLIRNSVATDAGYRFVMGKKPGLTPSVIAFTCIDFMIRGTGDSSLASLPRLGRDSGSPGRLLKLDEKTLVEALRIVETHTPSLKVIEKAGTLQLMASDLSIEMAQSVLSQRIGWAQT